MDVQTIFRAGWENGALPEKACETLLHRLRREGELPQVDIVGSLAIRVFGVDRQQVSLLGALALSVPNLPLLRRLLEAGADPNATGESGQSPLALAAGHGNEEAAFLLLEHGADPNARNDEGFTPLHVAAQFSQSPALVQRMISQGAMVHTRSDDGSLRCSPLMAACLNQPSIIEVVAAAGGRWDELDGAGSTPLHLAIESWNPACVEAALRLGAPLHGVEGQRRTPQEEALSLGDAAIIAVIEEALAREQHGKLEQVVPLPGVRVRGRM